jgi:hypothetical protein
MKFDVLTWLLQAARDLTQHRRGVPPGDPSEAMNQDIAHLPALVDEIKARLEVVEQVLLLRVPQRHGHQRHPQQPARGRGGGGGALLAGDDAADLLGGYGVARAAVGDEGDGGGADGGEDVGEARSRRVRGGAGEGGDGVVGVADEEAGADEVGRRGRGRSGDVDAAGCHYGRGGGNPTTIPLGSVLCCGGVRGRCASTPHLFTK